MFELYSEKFDLKLAKDDKIKENVTDYISSFIIIRKTGTVSIGSVESNISSQSLSKLLSKFHSKYPKVYRLGSLILDGYEL